MIDTLPGATLVCTDLVDSTRIHAGLGDERATALWAEHDRAARALLARHRGREVDRTDGFFLLFDAVGDAARFAIDYHDALVPLGLRSRVAVHVGPVLLRRNAADDVARGAKALEVEGLAKPYTARLMALAQGGQTLLSRSARDALAGQPGFAIEPLGHYRLKGLDGPVPVHGLVAPGRPGAGPPPDGDKAYRVVADGDLWRPVRSIETNLGGERDAFIGRAADLAALAARLEQGSHLVTVAGTGGIGKTRLVRRYGRGWLGEWPGGVFFCDLSEARSLDGVLFVVAATLGLRLDSSHALAQIGHALAARGRCLLILDNFEQVVEHAAATVGAWLDRCAEAAFVVTSRERLHLAGEQLIEIEPLPLADDAVALFEARVRAHRPGFAVGDAERGAVGEIVRLLDGLPLAIELAAARLRVLTPAQLVERLRDRFSALAGARGAGARQATLQAAIDWSWQLLTAWERAALAQCSVFEGGFTLASAEVVIDLGAWPDAPPVLDVVQSLVDKSLLRSRWAPAGRRLDVGEPYFGMYLSVHEYAARRLREEGDPVAAERRHGRHFAALGHTDAIDALYTHGGAQRRAALQPELDNLVAACRRAVGRRDGAVAAGAFRAAWAVIDLQGPFALAAELGLQVRDLETLDAADRIHVGQALGPALRRIGRRVEARACLDEALALARATSDAAGTAGALLALGSLDTSEGRVDDGIARIEEVIAIARESGDRRREGGALGSLGVMRHDTGRLDEARALYEASIRLLHEAGDRFAQGITLGNLATLHNDQGRLDEARAMYADTIEICREIGDREGEAITLGNLGKLELDLERLDAAAAAYEAGLHLGRTIGNRRNEGVVLGQLGIVLQRQGRIAEAQAHYEMAIAIARETGNRRFEGQALCNLGELRWEQGDIADGRARLAEAEALLRTIDDRMDLAELLCVRGRIDAAAGDRAAAEAALAEAAAIAGALGVEPASGLGQGLAKLRAVLGAAPSDGSGTA